MYSEMPLKTVAIDRVLLKQFFMCFSKLNFVPNVFRGIE